MGNHDVGRAMASAAKAYIKGRQGVEPTKAEALEFLDEIAEPWRGADAEFDDELYEDTPLKRLVAIAFDATPEEIADVETDFVSPWYDGPVRRFSDRYEFC